MGRDITRELSQAQARLDKAVREQQDAYTIARLAAEVKRLSAGAKKHAKNYR